MNIDITCGGLTLNARGIAVLKRSRGARIVVTRGTGWVTVDGEPRDVVLGANDQFLIESDNDVAISAIAGPVDFALRAAQHTAGKGLRGRIAALARRLRPAPALPAPPVHVAPAAA